MELGLKNILVMPTGEETDAGINELKNLVGSKR